MLSLCVFVFLICCVIIYFVLTRDIIMIEQMVTLGTDLSGVPVDIFGASYEAGGNRGVGIDVPDGYTKVNIGTDLVPIFKMKPIIPYGYAVSSDDTTTLVPKTNAIKMAIDSYKNATNRQLNQPPFEDIDGVDYTTVVSGVVTGKDVPLPRDLDTDGVTELPHKYYRVELTEGNGNKKHVMKPLPNPLPKGYIQGNRDNTDTTADFLVFNTTLYALQTFDKSDISYNARDTNIDYNSGDPKDAPDNNLGVYYQFDQNGNMVKIENTEANFSPVLYYIPGAYKFGSSNYVPNYEDSVYLSRTTRQSQLAPVYNTASMLGGFCTQNKNDSNTIEEKCGALDLNTCASTSCCTLLGGQKCVAGNENGPTNVANYSDYNLKNKDFYYYQGKCYGNCKGNAVPF